MRDDLAAPDSGVKVNILATLASYQLANVLHTTLTLTLKSGPQNILFFKFCNFRFLIELIEQIKQAIFIPSYTVTLPMLFRRVQITAGPSPV